MIITPEFLKDFCKREVHKLHVSVTKVEFEDWRMEMRQRVFVEKSKLDAKKRRNEKVQYYGIRLDSEHLAIPIFLSQSFYKLLSDEYHFPHYVVRDISFEFALEFLDKADTIIPLVFMKEGKEVA